jgi:hypothetical protein
VIEAKPQHGGGAAVQQAMAQLRAIAPWSDYLYLALEQDDWDNRSGPHQRQLEGEVGKLGFGLLLVDSEGNVSQQVEPHRNGDVEKRDELLLQLDVQLERAKLFSGRLGTTAAAVAASCLSEILESLDLIGSEWHAAFAGKDRSGSYGLWSLGVTEPAFVTVETQLEILRPHIYVEGDPFGGYLEDGEPRIWLWREVAELTPLAGLPLKPALRGWCFYASDKDNETDQTKRVEDVNIEHWQREGLTHWCHIGYPLTFLGRSRQGIRAEFKQALATARLKERRLRTKYS